MGKRAIANFFFQGLASVGSKYLREILLKKKAVFCFSLVGAHHAPGSAIDINNECELFLLIIEIFGDSSRYASSSISHVFLRSDRIEAR